MFGYVTFNVKYHILSQIFYKKSGGYFLTWKPMLYRTTSAIRALSGNIIATGLNSNFKLSGNSCLSLCSFDSGFMVMNLKR